MVSVLSLSAVFATLSLMSWVFPMWCANPLISLTDQDDEVSFMKYLQEGQSLSDTLISVPKKHRQIQIF